VEFHAAAVQVLLPDVGVDEAVADAVVLGLVGTLVVVLLAEAVAVPVGGAGQEAAEPLMSVVASLNRVVAGSRS
jgi:hypothetical protein